jgi:hypothetical protein
MLVVCATNGSTIMVTIADVAESSNGTTTDVLWHTLELVVTLLATAENTTLLLELVHCHGRESGSLMVGSSVVVNLVDGNGGVDYVGLDDLLLDNRLDSLVNVVVDMLAADSGCDTLALCGGLYPPLVAELSLLLNKVPLNRVMVAVVKLAMLYTTKLGGVCLGKHLTILDWLDCAVVVVLVDLLVDSGVDLLVYVRLHSLVDNRGGDSLVDGSVMVTGLLGEVVES